MKLSDIDLKGYGRFQSEAATFEIKRYHLPAPWDYVYTNGEVLWRLRHDGAGYAQIKPVAGPAFFRPERDHATPLMHTWIIPENDGAPQAFSNFWLPAIPLKHPRSEPEEYSCTFAPDAARYVLRHDDWLVETEAWVPPSGIAVIMTVRVTNKAVQTRRCTLMPVIKPHLSPMTLALWDITHTYQTAAFSFVKGQPAVSLVTRDSGGIPARRLYAAVLTDMRVDGFEVSANRFMGAGGWTSPEAVWNGKLALKPRKSFRYGVESLQNAITAQPPLAGFSKQLSLASEKSYEFSLVFGKLPDHAQGKPPRESDLAALQKYLRPQTRTKLIAQRRRKYEDDFALRRIDTPDAALNQYVNEWLPLQLEWVFMLDRGWPVTTRGTRDAAQDAAGLVATQPQAARARLCQIINLQRSDGWFMRTYSTLGRHGTHDVRSYVDSGAWVWELVRDYVYQTRDFKVLDEPLEWVDSTKAAPVLQHLIRAFEYFIDPKNIGEHGLCKIREGDWNDGINRAGLEGRGESVMVSCQVVLGLEEFAELLEHLAALGRRSLRLVAARFGKAAAKIRQGLLKHALNQKGYFNGVFNDDGKWIFSPRDPDGKARVSSTANSFAIIAGIVGGEKREAVVRALDSLKGPHGWRLFYPGVGIPPIAKLGRIGAGDRLPGLSENGTPYNHGSHGFLGRAAAVAGRGEWLYQIMRYMLPYDQRAHPLEVAKTAPYGVVNVWREIAGQDGRGGDTFLSGSISTAVRNIYQGLIGFRPGATQLVIDPVIPKAWRQFSAQVPFMDARFTLRIANPDGVECGVRELTVDDKPVAQQFYDARLGRQVLAIPIAALLPGRDCVIDVRLGK